MPRWRPPFISALAPEDRCHLNGLCLVEGRPAFVTALGTTDTPGGWRANKKSGGVLLDVPSGEVVARGLSMPHSPRWYDGRLWVLESGSGGFGWIDPATGKYEALTVLPGFTRGLDFCGPLAFIGLSQVRESAVFSGIAIAERPLAERCCGVWVVNIQTGQTVAFVKFEDAVQEIFAVQVLPGVRHPDVINDQPRVIADSFVVPDEALDLVPGPLRHAARENKEPSTARGDTAMTFKQWLRDAFGPGSRLRVLPAAASPGGLRIAGTCLCVESLEDRRMLAIFTVNSLLDNIDHSAGNSVLTLREAIAVVNAHSITGLQAGETAQITGTFGTNDTIQFAPTLATTTIGFGNGVSASMTPPILIKRPALPLFLISNTDTLIIDGETGLTKGITITRDGTAGLSASFMSAASGNLTLQRPDAQRRRRPGVRRRPCDLRMGRAAAAPAWEVRSSTRAR